MPGDRFEIVTAVRDEDIDQLGHVNNTVYLRWVQEAAIAHWEALATPEDQAAILWVVARHEIDYLRPALPGDGIVAATWVGPVSGRLFTRFTEIRRQSDGKALARAKTLWCPVDASTLSPTDATGSVKERFSVPEDPSTH
jgi:acyl-CoA thioester hydrolase